MFLYQIRNDLALKLVSIQDAEETFQLVEKNRAYLREWLPWVDSSKTAEDTKASFLSFLKNYGEQKSLTTAIMYQGKIAGIAGFNKIDWTNKIAYIGYWLGSEYQGKGIMTDVAKALTAYAFSELRLNRVEIRAAVENKKSRAIPERLGYKKEGTVRQTEWLYDHYVDHVIYGTLKSEWEQHI
ncbi:alanine acetyltransferase [Bacillus sp. LL01]|uniref:GNAT family N-acetyltransferase n=1 Tax=Bacillus sp. LL01 TaxID=1665556 RepID=UPI00064D2601|nr:GNAT family protein [Bacillus sp. LL01]KMJ55662.1 alanine acetyltransferase [Bacillus sp. LL01]